MKGHGADLNPKNRFNSLNYSNDPDYDGSDVKVKTEFFNDLSKSVLSTNNSLDTPFNVSLSPYLAARMVVHTGMEGRVTNSLDFLSGLDFKTKIMVKHDAPQLLWKALSKKSCKTQPITLSGVTDPYQLIERENRIRRNCLKGSLEFRNPDKKQILLFSP